MLKLQKLPDLPYKYDTLEPAISKKIMQLHHDKHHAGYVKKANKAIERLQSQNEVNYKHVLRDLSFNLNGHILHSVFWQNMKPYEKDNPPNEKVKKLLKANFGSFEIFKQQFSDVAASVEASGWGALVKDGNNQLQTIQIENHNKLFLNGYQLVLVVDVWEHAYYLDYQNQRQKYLQNWWQVVNWQNVESRLDLD